MREASHLSRIFPGEENHTYDQLGRTTQVLKKVYNVNYTTSYTFNLAGEVDTMTYPSGRVVKQQYDNIGRLSTVKNNGTGQPQYLSNVGYNTASEVTGFNYANGVSASYGYSANRLQLTSLSYASGGSNLLSLSYSYSQSGNNNGEIAGITDNVDGGRTVSYTYDSLHRLKTAVTTGSTNYPQWGLSWTYDRYGNRTAQTRTHGSTAPTNSPNISGSTNRITDMNSATFYYDSNGNLTQDDLYKYKYDAENRLAELRYLNNTLIASYAFDGKSLRVVKVWGADRTVYIYAGTNVIGEFEDAASNTYSAGTTPGQAGSDSTGVVLYQHGDHLTTRLTTENSGGLSNEQAHYPYGEQWYATGGADGSVERKFTSYNRDDEAANGKLNYAIFRQHSGRVGRFLMADPKRGNAGNPQRLNRYAYVTGNPISRTDRRGLDDRADDPDSPNWVARIDDSGIAEHLQALYDLPGGWILGASSWSPIDIITRTVGSILCPGTDDCSYYAAKCGDPTVSQKWYYCEWGPQYCQFFNVAGWPLPMGIPPVPAADLRQVQNCIRRCLQTKDNCSQIQDSISFNRCIWHLHFECYWQCSTNPACYLPQW